MWWVALLFPNRFLEQTSGKRVLQLHFCETPLLLWSATHVNNNNTIDAFFKLIFDKTKRNNKGLKYPIFTLHDVTWV